MLTSLIAYACLLSATPVEAPFGTPLAPDTLVLCAPALQAELHPWLAFRRSQGHHIRVTTRTDSPLAMRSAVRDAAHGGRLRWLLIVGDVQPEPAAQPLHAATHLAEAQVNSRFGSEPQIANDNWFADLDDDLAPELAVGRIPADSPQQLAAILGKIIRYEQAAAGGIWRRRVNLVAGVGGFGPLVDNVLESATRAFISRGIPLGYQTSMTYASWRSPYCPDPRAFRQQTLERMNEGCLCWVYIGHGRREGLDWVRVPPGVAPILNLEDTELVNCSSGSPIAVLLSCYGAAFDGADDCLAERLLARDSGPVAVIGGSRVTMPYGMSILSQGLMRQMFETQPATLGEMLLAAKRQTLESTATTAERPWLDALARALSPHEADLPVERQEHVLMFHLLGDPLTRVHHAGAVEVDVPRTARVGQRLAVRCRTAIAGDCTLELVCPRGRLTFQPEPRGEFDSTHVGMLELTQVYLRANDDRYVSHRCDSTAPEFTATLPLPADVRGSCAVRVFVQGAQTCALGAALLYVTETEPQSATESD